LSLYEGIMPFIFLSLVKVFILHVSPTHTGVQRKIDNEKLQSSLIDDDYVQVVETKNLNMAILQECHVIVLNQNGDIINIFEDTDANFLGICTDNYGNIW
jgi:CRISPR/Cas system-associated endonuclease Cas3-HD